MNSVTMATNAERVAIALKRHGVEHIFGMSNPVTIVLACEAAGIKQIGYRQENAGSYMTSGYALATGKIPVITGQGGPAAVLLNAGFAESLKASHPVVAILQELAVSYLDRNAFQEIDMEKLFLGTTKWVKRILSEDRIEDYLDMAFNIAGSGRPGPAVLLCPNNIFEDPEPHAVPAHRNMSLGTYPLDRSMAEPVRIAAAAAMLARAERPLVVAGGGVISSQAQQELRAIQEECALPVATTIMGKGAVDELHPLSIGPIGYVMGKRSWTEHLKPMVQSADVILLVGTRTNSNGTDNWTLLPTDAKYIHIDIDPAEIGRNYESLRLCGDAKLTLAKLKEDLLRQDLSLRKSRRAMIEQQIAAAHRQYEAGSRDVRLSAAVPLRVERLLDSLDKKLDQDHIIIGDASFATCWILNYIRAIGGRKFIFPRGLAGLSWGFPMAIGAQLGQPAKKVFCLCGDGSFGYVWSELEMCCRYGINVVVMVMNNSVLGYQKWWEVARFGTYTSAMDMGFVDHAAIAQACGVKGIRVERPEQIEAALDEAFATNGPVLLDCLVYDNCIAPIESMMYAEI